jgi:hypothetical protein
MAKQAKNRAEYNLKPGSTLRLDVQERCAVEIRVGSKGVVDIEILLPHSRGVNPKVGRSVKQVSDGLG